MNVVIFFKVYPILALGARFISHVAFASLAVATAGHLDHESALACKRQVQSNNYTSPMCRNTCMGIVTQSVGIENSWNLIGSD